MINSFKINLYHVHTNKHDIIAGYADIAFEPPLKINKTASALLTGIIMLSYFCMKNKLYKSVRQKFKLIRV